MEREMEQSDGPTASRADGKGSSRCQQDDNSQDGQIEGYPYLPEDILCHIHSLMPMRDAVRFARVSQAFLLSWRCHPNLAFSCSIKTLLALKENACRRDEIARDSVSQVDRILKNHSGIGVKTFRLHLPSICEKNLCHPDLLDSWLQIAVTPGIEELILTLSFFNAKYNNFPCSLLSDGTRESLRYLFLSSCNFHPTAGLGCLRSLSRLQLYTVHITDGELGCLLSNSFALERLELRYCDKLICLKILCLQRLSYLEVLYCTRLQVIESKAPKLSSFNFAGGLDVQISFGGTSRIKKLDWYCSNGALYARTELPSSMPNLGTLTVYSKREMANTSMMPSKFLHLKFLCIVVGRGTYDCFSLVSFFDASPSLETFILNVLRGLEECVSVSEDLSDLRRIPEQRHDKLKRVQIINFSSCKRLIELSCHILESATSLESLTLDTTNGGPRCSVSKSDKCFPMRLNALVEAQRALSAAQMYIKPKVPATVEFEVLEPCSRCHTVDQALDVNLSTYGS